MSTFGSVGALSLQQHLHRLEALRRRAIGQKGTDARQNRRLDALEREVMALGAALTAICELLRKKGLATTAELDGAIERTIAAAETAAAQERTAEAAVADAKAAVRRKNARRRRRS